MTLGIQDIVRILIKIYLICKQLVCEISSFAVSMGKYDRLKEMLRFQLFFLTIVLVLRGGPPES